MGGPPWMAAFPRRGCPPEDRTRCGADATGVYPHPPRLPHEMGREARTADPTRPWAWTAPPEQRRDKGGFGGKKTFPPKDIPRTPRTRGIRRSESAGTMPAASPAGRHFTAGAERQPLVLGCKPAGAMRADGPIDRRGPAVHFFPRETSMSDKRTSDKRTSDKRTSDKRTSDIEKLMDRRGRWEGEECPHHRPGRRRAGRLLGGRSGRRRRRRGRWFQCRRRANRRRSSD